MEQANRKIKNSTQECIIESHSEINNAKQSKTNEDEQNKTQRKRNSNQINKQDSKEKRPKANQKKSDQSLETEESREEKAKMENNEIAKNSKYKQETNKTGIKKGKMDQYCIEETHRKRTDALGTEKGNGKPKTKMQQTQDKKSRPRCPKSNKNMS